MMAYSLFSVGLWLVREHFLHVSWRVMLCVTTLAIYLVDAPIMMGTQTPSAQLAGPLRPMPLVGSARAQLSCRHTLGCSTVALTFCAAPL